MELAKTPQHQPRSRALSASVEFLENKGQANCILMFPGLAEDDLAFLSS